MSAHVSNELLERLVDGELDEPTYREVLSALSDEPDGWRRCALAFLENQALERDLCVAAVPSTEVRSVTARSVTRPPGIGQLLFAVAASFLIAFLAGHELQKWRYRHSHNPQIVGNSTSTPSQRPGTATPPRVLNQAEPHYFADSDPVGSVQLVVDGTDGNSQSVDVPVYSMDPTTSQLLLDNQTSLPPRLYEALRKLGSDVRRSQFWAPIDLQDGRQVVIPVDQYEITPASRSY